MLASEILYAPYARNQLMIDDFWLRLKRDLPKICDSYDQGYHFGYHLANGNSAENLARRHVYATQLFDLFNCIRHVMKSLAYEWKDIYGREGAPPMPVRMIEVSTKTLGLTVPRRAVSGAFPMGAQRNQRNRRYNRTMREPTAGLPGRCFDDSMFADEGNQAPTAPHGFFTLFGRPYGSVR